MATKNQASAKRNAAFRPTQSSPPDAPENSEGGERTPHQQVQDLLNAAIETMPAANSFDEDIAFKLRQLRDQLNQRLSDLKQL